MENPVTQESSVAEVEALQGQRGRGWFVRHFGLLLMVAFDALLIDQITKRLVEATIEPYQTKVIADFLTPYFTLTHAQNTGAAFSLLTEGGVIFFVVFAVVVGMIVYFAPRLPDRDKLSKVALGLQLGGATGNIIDRLRIGHVTDFLHLQIPQIGFDWPVSNIADICIVAGVAILFFVSFRKDGGEAA